MTSKNKRYSLTEWNELVEGVLKKQGKVVGKDGFEKKHVVGTKLMLFPLDMLDEFIDTLKSTEEIDAIHRTGYLLVDGIGEERAICLLKKCIEVSDRMNYAYGKAWAYAWLGTAFTGTNPKEALANHKIALNIFDELKNDEGLARVRTDMAMDYKTLGDFDAALKLLDNSLEYYTKTNAFDDIGNCCWRTGIIYLELSYRDKKNYKEYEKKGVIYLKRADEMYEKTGNNVERARVMRNFADITLDNGDVRKAREIYEKALKLDKDKNRVGEAYDLAGIAETYLDEDNFDKALGFVDNAIEIYDELDYIPDKCDLCFFTADCCHSCGRDDDARRYLKEAEEGYRKIGDKEGLAKTYFMLGTICLACGDFKGVKKYGDMAVKTDPEIMKKMAEEIKEALRNRK